MRLTIAATRTLLVLLVASLALGQSSDGWRRVAPGQTLELPRDHASHPDYRVEWWYYTGNVTSDDGRRFGYQLTFFRVGVNPTPANPSRWAVRDLYMTHLAVTDAGAQAFYFADRLNRAGVGWAGADTERYRVWNDDWSAELDADGRHVLNARDGAFGVRLALAPEKPAVRHGVGGYSQKGSEPGNASVYYSQTRMATTGTLTVDGREVRVSGLSWMDHEFGTSLLESGQTGWDWFSIQLDDATDLMLFEIRRADGSRDPRSSGTSVDRAGAGTALARDRFDLVPGRVWTSPSSGAAYPVVWHVSVPDEQLELDVRAVVDDQELRFERSTGVTYWEGAVDVAGTRAGRPVAGRGYLEMTGYAGVSMDRALQ